MEEVIQADAQHEQIEAFFEHPVDFAFPFLEVPVFGLEAGPAAVGEVAQAAVFEAWAFRDLEAGQVNGVLARDDVAVPEIAQSARSSKEVVTA